MVYAPAVMGEIGIAPRHAPLVTQLKPGEVRVDPGNGKPQEHFYVSGGMIEIQPKAVTVLADAAAQGFVSGHGAGVGQFWNPAGIAIDGRGRIAVADTGHGIDPDKLELAVVLHGSGARAALDEAAHQRHFGGPNPNRSLLVELADAGVRIYLCGQTAATMAMRRKTCCRRWPWPSPR